MKVRFFLFIHFLNRNLQFDLYACLLYTKARPYKCSIYRHIKTPYQEKNVEKIPGVMTRDELAELESAPKTKHQMVLDRMICGLPVIGGILAVLEYLYVPNYKENTCTYTYIGFLAVLTGAVLIAFLISVKKKKVFQKLRYKAPFYTLVFLLFMIYDYLTLKTGTLMLPYFPWVDKILISMIEDRAYLLDCVKNSLILLFTGYFTGVLFGLLTGIACGYNKKFNYWLEPFMRLLGAIPSTTWIPVVMVIASSLFKGSVFIIALGVWFSVTIATITGIHNIDKSYYEAARTLGARDMQLVFRIAIPSAVPSIFQGMTQAMSSACTALLVAEMIGVESGLGWYITWQKSWAQYGKMYAAIVLICLIFVTVNFGLNLIKRRVLRWQEGVVK